MKSIVGIAQINDTDGKPAGGLDVRLQSFSLASGRWSNVGSASTDSSGKLSITGRLNVDDGGPAPQVRLVRASNTAVLSEGGRINYDKAKGELGIEFGTIVDLGEQTIQPAVLAARFARTRLVLGGAPTVAVNAATVNAASNRAEANINVQPQVMMLNRQILARDDTITSLQKQLAEERSTSERLTANIARIPMLEATAAEKVNVENQLKAERVRIGQLEKRIADVRAENERLAAPRPKTIAVSTMAANLGTEIRSAQERLSNTQGALQLANVRIKLKGLPEEGGTKVTLPDEKDFEKANFIAGLADIDFHFRPAEEPDPTTGEVTVPDLRRMTEGAVRQVLHAIGLTLDPVAGPQASGGVAAGQASLQAPRAGETAERGSTVTVIFAS